SLTSLLKSWSQFAETNNIAWWIAHGEMIGWFWNAQLLPWDLDLDIQVSTYQLMNLIQFNQTVIDGRFLVDVNPYLLRRGAIGFNGMPSQNVIDARVVDTITGHFMDITGLSRTTTARWVSCKSPHNYFLNDVLPLHETMLDGIKVWRPHAPITLMEQEYGGHVLTSDYFEWTDNDIVYPFYWNATENKWIHVPSTINEGI
ncbi:LicD family-domain-containing protein, partial [Obelidium mucronatum]